MRESFLERGFTLEIIGEVTDIIYQNELNSYTVAEFEAEEGNIVIVGYLPFVNVGFAVLSSVNDNNGFTVYPLVAFVIASVSRYDLIA